MHLTLHQLRLLLAVSREGSVSGAARSLHLAQPTLSAQLRQLAEQAGLPLYEMIGRRLHLTAAGETLVATAARLEEELLDLDAALAQLRGDQGGKLRLAVVSTAETFIPRLLGEFCRTRPAVEVSLVVQNRQTVLERLAGNVDDLYIMTKPPPEQTVVATRFLRNPLVVIAPAGHPLTGRKKLAIGDLAGEEFVLRERGSGTRGATEVFFALHGQSLRPRMELGSNEAVRQAVAGGLGISVISVYALGAFPESEGIAVLPVRETPIPTFWKVVHPAGKRPTPLVRTFLEFLGARAIALEKQAEARLAHAWASYLGDSAWPER